VITMAHPGASGMVKPPRNSETPGLRLMIQDTGMRARSVPRVAFLADQKPFQY